MVFRFDFFIIVVDKKYVDYNIVEIKGWDQQQCLMEEHVLTKNHGLAASESYNNK